MASKSPTPRLLARAVALEDGPHRLEAARWPAIAYVQDCGHVIGHFTKPATDTLTLYGEWHALAVACAKLGSEGKLSPDEVLTGVEAIDVAVTMVPDFAAIAAGLTGLLRQSEPDEGWTVERVSDLMIPAKWDTYRDAVSELYKAAFASDSPSATSAEGET